MNYDDPTDDEILGTLPSRKPEVKVESKARNERQYWIDETCKLLKKPYIQVAVKVTGWPVDWIRDLYLQVTNPEVSNPPALWWHIVNNPKK